MGITGTQIQKIVTVDVKYPVTGIEVKPPVAAPEGEAAQVWSGETLQMGVSYTPVDASDRSVKWSVTGPATIGEDTGLLKINNDAASNAVVTVTAKLAADANITDSYSFTVQAALESLDIQGPAQLKKGQTAEYSIQYNPVDWQYVQTITWDLIRCV